MTDVKRYDCTNGGYRHCQGCYEMTETPLGDYVRSEDYDALAAKLAMAEDAAAKGDAARQQCGAMEMEVEELRAELAELRARVVVWPEEIQMVLALADRIEEAKEQPIAIALDGARILRELARLNGKAVSEGLLRRIVTPALTSSDAQDRIGALEELCALLSEQA